MVHGDPATPCGGHTFFFFAWGNRVGKAPAHTIATAAGGAWAGVPAALPGAPPVAWRIHVAPLTVDDSEIIECSQAAVEEVGNAPPPPEPSPLPVY